MAEKELIHNIGKERLKFMLECNDACIRENYNQAEECIVSFLDLVESDEYKILIEKIKDGFDKSYKKYTENREALEEEFKKSRYLEQKDLVNAKIQAITLEWIRDRRAICWSVGLEHGLFY